MLTIGPGADTLTINGDTTISQDILIIGGGVVIGNNANMTLYGSNNILDSAQLIIRGGALIIPQDYLYERSINAINRAAVTFEHAEILITNGNAGANTADDASWTMRGVTFPQSFFTLGAAGHAHVNVDSCAVGGEFIFTDSSVSTFANSGMIIAWQWITAGQVVDEQYPDTAVAQWAFPDSATQAGGCRITDRFHAMHRHRLDGTAFDGCLADVAQLARAGNRTDFQRRRFRCNNRNRKRRGMGECPFSRYQPNASAGE